MPEDVTHEATDILDLTEFTSRDTCLELAASGCPTIYTQIAKEHLTDVPLTEALMVFMSMISRARGLHEGILRELNADNPHAVLPLERAMTELVTIVMYTAKHPEYLRTLLGQDFKRKSFEAMFHRLQDEAPD